MGALRNSTRPKSRETHTKVWSDIKEKKEPKRLGYRTVQKKVN